MSKGSSGPISITVQPQTLTNVTVSNGTTTYPIEECTLSVVNGQTIYNFYAGDSSCYPFGASTTSLTFNADGCQPYTISDIKAESEWTVTMQPATGYRKLYAWKVYMPACTPTYIYTDTATPTELSALYTNTGERLALSDISYSSYVAGSITYATSNSIQLEPVSGATVPIK